MTVVTQLEPLQQWLCETDGWQRLQADEGKGTPISPQDLMKLCDRAEWVKIEDLSDLRYAKEGYMHPMGLCVGSGDYEKAVCEDKSDRDWVIFFNAYRS